MNNQIRNDLSQIQAPSAVRKAQQDSTPDADTQALLDLGQLAYLCNTYESLVNTGGSQDLINKTFAEIQKLLSYYNVNGSTITFGYNEGAQTTTLSDPGVLEMLQKILPVFSNPPTAANISDFLTNYWNSSATITWGDGQQQTIVERILLFLYDSNYSMSANINSTITNTSFLFFYLSLVNTPGSEAAGTLDDILSKGYYDGAMFNQGNIRAIARTLRDHLANDSTLLSSDVILAGLQIATNDPLYPLIGTLFQTDLSQPAQDESGDWNWQVRFFITGNGYVQVSIDAMPDKENTQLENQLALEKKWMSQKDEDNFSAKRKQERI